MRRLLLNSVAEICGSAILALPLNSALIPGAVKSWQAARLDVCTVHYHHPEFLLRGFSSGSMQTAAK
ncbi:hypothetical protein CLOM_g6284 [Closterium sp. NIES-68]|nr:hypothetical protein CLOM_g6284 [Closterium sp. NIES-68]